MNCKNCGIETANPSYCSRRCSAIHTNKNKPPRRRKTTCTQCDKITKSYRHTLCEEHWAEYQEGRWKNRTIGEYRKGQALIGKHPSWIHAQVRNFARSWNQDLRRLPCARCGYSKHVELAHVNSISSYPDTALLKDINSKENLIQLCPNCHWEFDNLCS